MPLFADDFGKMIHEMDTPESLQDMLPEEERKEAERNRIYKEIEADLIGTVSLLPSE